MGSDGAGFQVQVHGFPESLLVPYCQTSNTGPYENENTFCFDEIKQVERVNWGKETKAEMGGGSLICFQGGLHPNHTWPVWPRKKVVVIGKKAQTHKEGDLPEIEAFQELSSYDWK